MSFCGLGKKPPKLGRGMPRDPPPSTHCLDISGVTVSTEKGDITRGKGDAVVAGTDRELSTNGAVMKALSSAGGKKYRKKLKRLRERLESESGRAGRLPRVYTTAGGKLGYSYVLHVIMPQFRAEQDWYGAMKYLYRDVIAEAEANLCKVMRMPVLGSGKAAGPVDVSVKALLDAMKEYTPFEHLRHVIVMDTDDSHIRCIVKEMESRRDGSPKYNIPSQEPPDEDRSRNKVRRSRSVDGRHSHNSHSSSNSRQVQENHAGGAAWNGDQKPWGDDDRYRGGNSSAAKGGYSSQPAHEAEQEGFRFAGASSHPDQVQDVKKKSGTFPRTRKPRNERVFDYEERHPANPEDFRYSNKSQAQPASSALTNDTSPPRSWERRSPHSQDDRPPPAGEPQPRFDQRPQQSSSREMQQSYMRNAVKPSPRQEVKQTPGSLAAQSVSSHATALLQSPKAEMPQTRAAVGEKAAGPQGKMVDYVKPIKLPGHYDCGTIVIEYSFANGVQGHTDPRPGQPYKGIFKRAYLPDSAKGRELLRRLRVAFDLGLLFEIRAGDGGGEDVVTLKKIPHKTSVSGGPDREAYPDPDYLERLERALAREGVTRDARL